MNIISTNNKQHWENVFATKAESEFSWYQPNPQTTIDFFESCNVNIDAQIIDMGAGDSYFVDALITKGYKNISVLDISAMALDRAKNRIGEKAKQINWIESDMLDFNPSVSYDFWHDRAAFHFLTQQQQIEKYVFLVSKSISKNGYLLLGTFADDGPEKCSGLAVTRYNENVMKVLFEKSFDCIKCVYENHTTPFNTVQQFLFCLFRKKKGKQKLHNVIF